MLKEEPKGLARPKRNAPDRGYPPGPGGGGKSVVLQLVVDARILGAGLLFSLLMGALGGLIPALSAMRLKPLESQR